MFGTCLLQDNTSCYHCITLTTVWCVCIQLYRLVKACLLRCAFASPDHKEATEQQAQRIMNPLSPLTSASCLSLFFATATNPAGTPFSLLWFLSTGSLYALQYTEEWMNWFGVWEKRPSTGSGCRWWLAPHGLPHTLVHFILFKDCLFI